MDYESLTRIKPDIICLSMTGFGHTGPHTHYVSFGPTLQAMAGYTLMMADENDRPAGFSYSYSDSAAGFTGALAVMLALWNRKCTGRGQFIDFAQFEGLTSLIGPSLLDITVNNASSQPFKWLSQERPAAPHGAYRCLNEDGDNDRWIVISAQTNQQWQALVRTMESPGWTLEPRFRTLYSRISHRRELDVLIETWTARQRAQDAVLLLQTAGVPCGLVANARDSCEADPQLKARAYWPAVTMPDGSVTHVSGMPFKLSMTPPAVLSGSHEVGADAQYVLGELLGMGRAERDQLIKDNVIWV